MTEQEAIEILEQDTKTLSEAINESNLERVKNVLSGRVEANNVAIKALEKQIPKPVVFDENEWTCPHCNTPVLDVNIGWCDICGQKLDWSEEE